MLLSRGQARYREEHSLISSHYRFPLSAAKKRVRRGPERADLGLGRQGDWVLGNNGSKGGWKTVPLFHLDVIGQWRRPGRGAGSGEEGRW